MRTAKASVLAIILAVQASAASRNSLVTKTEIPGATLRIEVQQPIADEKAAEIVEWLRSASSNVSLAYGRFPNPSEVEDAVAQHLEP